MRLLLALLLILSIGCASSEVDKQIESARVEKSTIHAEWLKLEPQKKELVKLKERANQLREEITAVHAEIEQLSKKKAQR